MHDKRRWIRINVEREDLERKIRINKVNAKLFGKRPKLSKVQESCGARRIG